MSTTLAHVPALKSFVAGPSLFETLPMTAPAAGPDSAATLARRYLAAAEAERRAESAFNAASRTPGAEDRTIGRMERKFLAALDSHEAARAELLDHMRAAGVRFVVVQPGTRHGLLIMDVADEVGRLLVVPAAAGAVA